MIKLHTRLFYDTVTGEAWYKEKCRNRPVLKKLTANSKGYLYVSINGKHIGLHRAVWMHFYGDIPKGMEIDHIDCDKTNNALLNLRLVDRLTNARNKKPPANSSGYPGIVWIKKYRIWGASVHVRKKAVWNASGHDARDLYNKYREAKKRFHGEDSLRHYPPPIDTSRFSVAYPLDNKHASSTTNT